MDMLSGDSKDFKNLFGGLGKNYRMPPKKGGKLRTRGAKAKKANKKDDDWEDATDEMMMAMMMGDMMNMGPMGMDDDDMMNMMMGEMPGMGKKAKNKK